MNKTSALLLFSILSTSQAFAWTVSADFEQGTIGTIAYSNADAFHSSNANSFYADTPALSGSQSVSLTAIEGETGFGSWGGYLSHPTLYQGDEIWYRVNVYYPTGWDFSCGGCTEGMKFMRIHTLSADGSNQGYHSTLIKGGSTGGLLNINTEVTGAFYNNNTADEFRNLGNPVLRENWHTYEIYLKISSVAGQGIYRVWQDGVLMFEDKESPTLRSSTSKVNGALLYTYWNNGAPKTQTSYADDIILTNEIPGRKDAAGNPYIGVGSSIYVAPPKPASWGPTP